MATSGSTNFSQTTNSIIKNALKRIGALDVNEQPEASDYETGREWLNYIMKTAAVMGWNVFRSAESSVTLLAGQAEYTFGGSGSPDVSFRPLRIEEARWRNSAGTDLSMQRLSRDDYFTQPNKTTQGTPTTFYYNPGSTQGKMYVWPVPDANTATTIQFTYQRTLEDFDDTDDEPDLPQEWYGPIVKALAAELAPIYFPENPAIVQSAKQQADQAIQEVMGYDREEASVFMTWEGRR